MDDINAQLDLLSVSTCSSISERDCRVKRSGKQKINKRMRVAQKSREPSKASKTRSVHRSSPFEIVSRTALTSSLRPQKRLVVILDGVTGLSTSLDQQVIQCCLNTEEDGDVAAQPISWSAEFAIPCASEEAETGNALRFTLRHVNFVFQTQRKTFLDKDGTPYVKSLIVISARSNVPHAEWHYLTQMRISTAAASGDLRVVDSNVFEFGARVIAPLLIDVNVDVRRVKFELRYIRQVYHELPNFKDGGDVAIVFLNESTFLCAHGALLAMHSPKLATALAIASKEAHGVKTKGMIELHVEKCTSDEFLELLWQLYPTQRPIYADFRRLCRAALAFSVRRVIDELVAHLVAYSHLDFVAKIKEAIKLELFEAIVSLVFNAVKSGRWGQMINAGFDPTKAFSEKICDDYIYPAVLSAKSSLHSIAGAFAHSQSVVGRRFTGAHVAADPNNVRLVVNCHIFFVNKGVMAMHNDAMFGRGNDGEFYPVVTLELRNELEHCNLALEEVMESLLTFLYDGDVRTIRAEFVRPLIVFASVHRMPYLLRAMEEMLIEEPPISAAFMFDHLSFAERYGLENLLRVTLFRMESSYRDAAQCLVADRNRFGQLSASTQRLVRNRMCAGWAAFGVKWAGRRHGTVQRQRHVGVGTGGSVRVAETVPSSLHCVESDHVFGSK